MTVRQFVPGGRSQIRLVHDTSAFPSFEVRNIIANGESGPAMATRGGICSGDVVARGRQSPEREHVQHWLPAFVRSVPLLHRRRSHRRGRPRISGVACVEPAIANLVGHVDVHVVNQHGSMGEETDPFLLALASKVLIIPSWAPSHPAPDVLKRIMNSRLPPLERLVFVTDLRDAARTVIGQRANSIAGPPGHIVVRVDPVARDTR